MNSEMTGGNSVRVKVDTLKCTGHARCIAVAPQVYVLNVDGYNEMTETNVRAGFEDEARRGAKACPEMAITVI
jgi:ferredoxin